MFDYEKLGAFYLGRDYDSTTGQLQPGYVMYADKDLTTHAVIVGMTGSGKTGLGITLLEEAAIDGIPALIIDPKGDMGNLLLNFPKLDSQDFQPWIDPDAALRQGMTVEEYAADRAQLWEKGLKSWEQGKDRIQRLRDAAEVVIYTPGSDAGVPLSILKSLDAPSAALLADAEALRERVSTAVSGLLALLGINADPLQSREHILLSNILDQAWRQGRNLDLPTLIREIQSPPFSSIGVMDLETIFPATARMQLAMQINNLLASPSFASWREGEPLNIQNLLYTPNGKPRLAILSIAHLADSERMFFVTLLLNEVISWMRQQSGTSSLRAILYMDEVFGYLPPSANPPSKVPMLTLLKQARAFGVGLVLSTQNPVDLDYKALSNAGTWFLGRLQTERDKLRVLDGLEGAAASSGQTFNRATMDRLLSGLGSRVFLMNNVHDAEPIIFQSRWALSYLSGPMTRAQIASVMAAYKQAFPLRSITTSAPSTQPPFEMYRADRLEGSTSSLEDASGSGHPPVLPAGIEQCFVPVARSTPREARILYQPALYAEGTLHFVDAKSKVDTWTRSRWLLSLSAEMDVEPDPWQAAEELQEPVWQLEMQPLPDARFSEIPPAPARKTSWTRWQSSFRNFLYREQTLLLQFSPDYKVYSTPQEEEGAFVARLRQNAREQRDMEVAKLKSRYDSRMKTMIDRIRKAEVRVDKQKSQASNATVSAAVSIGTSLLGALFGRKALSATNVSKAGTSVRSASRAASSRSNVRHAEEEVGKLQEDLRQLEAELQTEVDRIDSAHCEEKLRIEPYEITPRKSDLAVDRLCLLWLPYQVEANGRLTAAFATT